MLNNNNNEWIFREIEVEGFKYRLYNEEQCGVEFVLYLENSIKIHKLIEKYKYRLFYIKTSPKTNLEIKFDEKELNLESEDVKKIKFHQSNDLYFLYTNIFFELFYSFPYINNQNKYHFDLLILVQHDFDIKKISGHNFNLINVESCVEIKKDKVNFDFFKTLFESRSIINDWTVSNKESTTAFLDDKLSLANFIKNYNNGNSEFELEQYHNVNSFYYQKNFNQNLYVQMRFKYLCTNIWDFGRNYYIEKNKFGERLSYDDLYENIITFFTNFGELIDVKTLEKNNSGLLKVEGIQNYVCSMKENEHNIDIQSGSLSKEFVLNYSINVNNKEIRIKKNDKKTSINNIIV